MTFERYGGWLARGRAHQAQGSVIDALLCYRRALREVPAGVDAQFHLGEIAWHLGNPADAIALWQATVALSAMHLPSLQALADGFAAMGRFDASLQAARRVLAVQSHEPRAIALSALTRMALGHWIDDAEIASALLSNFRWPLELLAAIGVRVLERQGEYPATTTLVFDAVANASVTAATEDALRSVAFAAAKAGDLERAQTFADRYAHACHALHRQTMPLLWPLRTAGRTLRVGLLVTDQALEDATRIVAAIDRRLAARAQCTVFVASSRGDALQQRTPAVRAVPNDADLAARGMAALDLDVLVDLEGAGAAFGPLLARHPAREVWALQHDDVPPLRRLVERVFAEPSANRLAVLVDALDALHVTLARHPVAAMSAAELASLWDEAVHAHQRGAIDVAKAAYARFLAVQPQFASALYLSGMLARMENDFTAARQRLRAAVSSVPDFVDAWGALADVELITGNPTDAETVARQGLGLFADSAVLWRALGQAALKQGDARRAADAFVEALKRDPSHGETHYNHGVALQTTRDSSEAARAYQRALAFRPDLHAADFNLGVIFDHQGNAAGAIAAFSNVLARAPTHVAAYKALAETLLACGRIDAWFANFERFEQHCPNHLSLAAHALEICAYRADFAKLEDYLDDLRNGRFSDGEPQEMLDALQQILYLLHFFDVEPALIGRFARTHDAIARRMYGEPWPRRILREPGKLRVGYVSGDFRNHVMGKMMWEALRQHDLDAVHLFGYTTNDNRDEWTHRYDAQFGGLHSLATLTDRDAAQRIAADDLDVLVDLSTHTKGARPGILALKPARVQITHVASAGTLAMSAIDFKLTDRYADLAHDPAMQIESPLVMDGCVYPFRHVAPAPAGTYTRERLRLPAHAILIGAFVTPLKLSQRCLALWREVLHRVPAAMLGFSPVHPSLRRVFQRLCAVAGIDERRITFLPQGRDDAENQARYRLVDFVLDPLPYGGVNGTLEALDMHVPVVTLVGQRHAERTSYSLLMNLGVTDTIAQTGGDYVGIAVRLATDRGFANDIRSRIASALGDSTLTDMPAHARSLERAYLAAVEACVPEIVDDVRRRA